ncbi:cytochrome P450 [Actinomadura gamaensis]|uniref:Cytochrome P450 n=1 Tax=Actinomadura gamaensis TaxID=1763541 RepID=A0ABV9TWE1_9ACTN
MPLLKHDLTEPDFWARDDCHALLAAMRREAPVQRHHSASEGPLWAVLSYRHAAEVLADPATYSSRGGSLLGTGPDGPPAGTDRMMALSDPPRHRRYRDPALPLLSNRRAAALSGRVRELTGRVVRRALERGEIDFVRDIGAAVPLTVMCDLMGVAEADRDAIVRLCDQAFLAPDAERRRAAHQRLLPYLFREALARRDHPGDDLIGALSAPQPDGTRLSVEETVLNCDNIIVGGIQTVRHTAAMSMLALLRHPGHLRTMLDGDADPRRATEELLRWTSVGLHVLRTARRDTELGGCRVREGDRVVVWVPPANRDEAEFTAPGVLRLDRHPNRHLAFGWGPHYCIGAPLARLELTALFEALAEHVGAIEQTAEPVHNRSIINFGLESLRVTLRPARRPAGPAAALR